MPENPELLNDLKLENGSGSGSGDLSQKRRSDGKRNLSNHPEHNKWWTLWLVIGLGSVLTMLARSACVCCSSVVVLRRSACGSHGEQGTGLRRIRFH